MYCTSIWSPLDSHNSFDPMPPTPAPPSDLVEGDVSRIIEMAWADEIPFEAIRFQFGLDESAVIRLMKRSLKPSSFLLWRRRVQGRSAKHARRQQAGWRAPVHPLNTLSA